MTLLRQTILAASLGAAVLALAVPASAQELPSSVHYDHSSVRLLAGGAESEHWNAGVEIELGPGWKTYWRVPGEAGVPPHFEWKGSRNLKGVDVEWPAPKRYFDEAGESIGYKDRVVFPLKVKPADASKPVHLKLDLFYAVCNDICIPGNAKLALTLDKPGGAKRDGRLIRQFRGKVPAFDGSIQLKSAIVDEYGESFILSVATSGVQSPAATDIFVEGSEELHFRKPKLVSDSDGNQAYHLKIDGLKTVDGLKGQKLILTIVDSGSAVTGPVTVN